MNNCVTYVQDYEDQKLPEGICKFFMDECMKNLYELRRDKIVVTTFIKILFTAYKIVMT